MTSPVTEWSSSSEIAGCGGHAFLASHVPFQHRREKAHGLRSDGRIANCSYRRSLDRKAVVVVTPHKRRPLHNAGIRQCAPDKPNPQRTALKMMPVAPRRGSRSSSCCDGSWLGLRRISHDSYRGSPPCLTRSVITGFPRRARANPDWGLWLRKPRSSGSQQRKGSL